MGVALRLVPLVLGLLILLPLAAAEDAGSNHSTFEGDSGAPPQGDARLATLAVLAAASFSALAVVGALAVMRWSAR